jgi:hypothetical protein
VLSLLRLHVGIDATLGRVRLDLQGVDAQALLKVRLDKVAEIVEGVLAATVNANPQIVEELAHGARAALTETSIGARRLLTETGPGVGEAVAGATQGLELGLGQAAGNIGRAAEQAGQAVGEGSLGGEPSLEARAEVDAESWHAGERRARRGERPRGRRLPRRAGPEE